MYIPEYNTGITDDLVSNLAHIIPKHNESIIPVDDYLYDHMKHNGSDYSGESQHLAAMLQQMFSKMSDNQTAFDLSFQTESSSSSLPSSSNDANPYHLLSVISLWFVLLINPIVVIIKIKSLFQTDFFSSLLNRFYSVSLVTYVLLIY